MMGGERVIRGGEKIIRGGEKLMRDGERIIRGGEKIIRGWREVHEGRDAHGPPSAPQDLSPPLMVCSRTFCMFVL